MKRLDNKVAIVTGASKGIGAGIANAFGAEGSAVVVNYIHEDKRLRRMFLERYVIPRRQIQRGIIEDAIASGELRRATDPELLIDALNGPLFFRWLQGHAPLGKSFAERIFERVIPAHTGRRSGSRRGYLD